VVFQKRIFRRQNLGMENVTQQGTSYSVGDRVKWAEISVDCSILGAKEKSVHSFVRKSWRDENTWKTKAKLRGQHFKETGGEKVD
jgi:hypothetical protein